MSSRRTLSSLCVVLVVLASGCGSGDQDDPILRLSAQEAFDEGQRLFAEEKYLRAHAYFAHAFQIEPNSQVGRDALMLEADSFFLAGGEDQLVRAEAKYRDFQNRFPTSARADYVQYQLARSLEQRVRKPDRDQKATIDALQAFQNLVELYPTSEYSQAAQEQIFQLRNRLAEHEYLVGQFNYRRRFGVAAVNRLEGLMADYPDYPEMDKVLWHLGMSYRLVQRAEEAETTFARLREDHPDSKYLSKIPKKDIPVKGEPE